MAENTKIHWTDHSFNGWWGCTKVSPGCDFCYAERDSVRFGFDVWGNGKARRYFGDKHWNEPLKWNERARKNGVKEKVFAFSMSDWADNEIEQGHRDRLWSTIRRTDWLIWQLLTKRVGNVKKMLPADWGDGYNNVWMGISVVDQEEADRDVPKLLQAPAALWWLSIEPQLGLIRLREEWLHRLGWIVYGGESGIERKVRPFDLRWAREGIAQCAEAGIACFIKQIGSNAVGHNGTGRYVTKDYKGANPEEWPEDLRVREFPIWDYGNPAQGRL